MNPFSNSDVINIEGFAIKVPHIQSTNEEPPSPSVLFEKPSWLPDVEVSSCLNCQQKFTQIRRKHHCRNCGKIFCNKCCSDRVCLLQFGMEEPQRVCHSCKATADLIAKSRSESLSLKHEAVIGLARLAGTPADLSKMVECGGVHILLSLAMEGDIVIKSAVAGALHSIAQRMVLNPLLIEAGSLKVLKYIIDTAASDQYLLLSDSLSALTLLCQDSAIRLQVLKTGMIDSLVVLINYSGTTALLAARILALLIDNLETHNFILQHHVSLLPGLLRALQLDDFQMQTTITKMLVHLSAGSETCRHLLLQEDQAHGTPLIYLLKGSRAIVLLNSACIVANLATSSLEHGFDHRYITVLCELLDVVNEDSIDLITHVGRGLANFAESPANSLLLVNHLNSIVATLLKSKEEVHRYHACRILVSLLATEPSCTLQVLSREGMEPFLETLFSLPGLSSTLTTSLLRKVSRLSVCLQKAL